MADVEPRCSVGRMTPGIETGQVQDRAEKQPMWYDYRGKVTGIRGGKRKRTGESGLRKSQFGKVLGIFSFARRWQYFPLRSPVFGSMRKPKILEKSMGNHLPVDRREDFGAWGKPGWKTWCLRWLVVGVGLFCFGLGIDEVGSGLISGVSTFFAGILLTHTVLNPDHTVFDLAGECLVAMLKQIIPRRFPLLLRIAGLSVAIILYFPKWFIFLVVLGVAAFEAGWKTLSPSRDVAP